MPKGKGMKKQSFRPENARSDLPYSPLIRAGDLYFVSGQVPIDPETKTVVGEDIRSQTRQTLENIKATLALAGITLEHVVKVNIFLTDMTNFKEMNEVYREYFPNEPPARTTVGTSALSHPDMKIEIEAIALAD